MIQLAITLDVEAHPWTDLADRGVVEGELTRIGMLRGGTISGLPTVSFIIETPDGNVVHAQTTWRVLHAAAHALEAKWGEPR